MNEDPSKTPNPANAMPAQPAPGLVAADTAASPNPTTRPMQQAAASEPEPTKKKKVGLIIGIVVAILLLIGGGVAAAIVITNLNKVDPVTRAMGKIMNGEAPNNVAIDGDINIKINDDLSPISNVNIALKSNAIVNSMLNNSRAELTVGLRGIGDLTADFDEIYAGNGDLYFRLDGVYDALDKSGILYLLNLTGQLPEVVDCGADGYCETAEIEKVACGDEEDCSLPQIDDTKLNILGDGGQSILSEDTIAYFASLEKLIEIIDGDWLKVSLDELNMFTDGVASNSEISCITNLVSDINTNSNSAAELYSKSPFIVSSQKDVRIESKQYPVYRIGIDDEKFANYVNSIQNPALANDLYNCLGWQSNVKINAEDVAEIVDSWPIIYTEVDNDDNFSRLYLESDLNEGEVTVVIDLGFAYPKNVSVPEPEEYQDFSDVIQEISSGIYALPVDN